jgi:hypothetical protein
MKNIAICLSMLCLVLFGAGCKTDPGVSPGGNGDAHEKLIAAKYTEEKIEGSQDGVTWVNYSLLYTREVLTLKPQGAYSSATLTLTTGVVDDYFNGSWSLSPNGNSFKCVIFSSSQDFTIISLTPTTMVVTFQGHNLNTMFKSSYYPYNKITYTRSAL